MNHERPCEDKFALSRPVGDEELREIMTYHFRRGLEDALLAGELPPEIARVVEESPDVVVDLLVNTLAPGAMSRINAESDAPRQDALDVPPQLAADDIGLLILALTSVKSSSERPADVDLDGALLFCHRGRKMLKKECYRDAKRLFERALSIKNDVKCAWEGLSEALEQLGETERAAETRRRAEQL